jgi:uncharacterized protein (TIGR00369 family)
LSRKVGNPEQKILHGGVMATALDLAGGVVAAVNIFTQLAELSAKIIVQNLSRLNTIDLRINLLKPGVEKFIVTAKIICSGRKVAVARMEMHNKKGDHIAFGNGTYIIG